MRHQSCWLGNIVYLVSIELGVPSSDVAYNLTFKTGDMEGAGTDANVTLQLHGERGQTEKIMLRQDRAKTLRRFDRGRTDRFTVQTMDVGTVRYGLKTLLMLRASVGLIPGDGETSLAFSVLKIGSSRWAENTGSEMFNPFTPKFKKYILPTFLKKNV